MTTGQFSLITGAGHCGTKWLTTVLHHPDQGVVAFHELAHQADHRWWKDRQRRARDLGVDRDAFPAYWQTVDWHLSQHRHAIDSQSWCPIEAAKVASLAAAGRAYVIAYLVRNGIQQLHSIAHVSTWKHIPDHHFLYGPFLASYWEIAGRPHKPWGQWTRWEKLCLWWAANDFMPPWMRANYETPVEIYRLEDLVTHLHALRALISPYGLRLSDEQLSSYQATDVNRKVHGDRRPETLWASWSSVQQAAFRRICGPAMSTYGYEVPS